MTSPSLDNKISETPKNRIKTLKTISPTYSILDQRIGSGAFGTIYLCKNNKNGEILAAKVEKNDSRHPQLANEYKILTALKGNKGFPRVYGYVWGSGESVVIMQLLGANMETLMSGVKSKKFTMKTTLMFFLQSLLRLQVLHSKGFIHRDIKPENFLISKNALETDIFLLDFGLGKSFWSKSGHIPFREKVEMIGTMRYISMNVHQGFEQSRRDDLESLCYLFVYFVKGELPWMNVKARSKREKYGKVFDIKRRCVPMEICKVFPEEIRKIFGYVLGLTFTQSPDYIFLSDLIRNLLKKYGYEEDYKYDWHSPPEFLENLYQNFSEENTRRESSIFSEDDSGESRSDKDISVSNSLNNNAFKGSGIKVKKSVINDIKCGGGVKNIKQSVNKIPVKNAFNSGKALVKIPKITLKQSASNNNNNSNGRKNSKDNKKVCSKYVKNASTSPSKNIFNRKSQINLPEYLNAFKMQNVCSAKKVKETGRFDGLYGSLFGLDKKRKLSFTKGKGECENNG